MVVGLAAIPAGVLFGVIWSQATAGVAFGVFGGLAIVSAVLLRRGQLEGRREIVL